MIRGIDFYDHILSFSKDFENVRFLNETITHMEGGIDVAVVQTDVGRYKADYVFNSTTLFNPPMSKDDSLLQHFLGWVIKTDKPIFDSTTGTLMDFSIPQTHGTTFMYVLPTSSNEALVEHTLFTPETLTEEEYAEGLEDYIQNTLLIKNYKVLHKEYGVIPMSKAKFQSSPENRIINIGTAGGSTKASTGYTFQFVQKSCDTIVKFLQSDKSLPVSKSFRERVFHWYDLTLLEVLLSGRLEGKAIFEAMFRKVEPERILAFLGNESTFIDEFIIMNSVPFAPFFRSGLTELKP